MRSTFMLMKDHMLLCVNWKHYVSEMFVFVFVLCCVVSCCVKGEVSDSGEKILIFQQPNKFTLCPVHEHEQPLLLIGWNTVVWFGQNHFVCFLFTEPGLCTDTFSLFSDHTQNRQLAEREESFAELDNTFIGIRIAYSTFKLYSILCYYMASGSVFLFHPLLATVAQYWGVCVC